MSSRPNRASRRRREAGFTLMELLIAVGIFALLAVAAYRGLDLVLTSDRQTADTQRALGELQTAFAMLARDLEQPRPRPVRDTFGDPLAPLIGNPQGAPYLELTRGGHVNPLQQGRSTLQRVAYRVTDRRLIRLSWPHLDRAADARPLELALADGIGALEFRFIDGNGRALRDWPPLLPPGETPPEFPRAIEVLIESERFGPLRRLFVMPAPGDPEGPAR